MSRLTIHDLFWLIVVLAIAAGWWLDSKNRNEKIADERSANEVLRSDIEKLEREISRLQKLIMPQNRSQ